MKLLTLTGPSCSGKTTLLNNLVGHHGFVSIVSHTTRPPRQGEQEGIDYYFVSQEKFDEMLANNLLMENVVFSGYSYGVSVQEIVEAERTGMTPVVIVEPNGLAQMRKYAADNNIQLKTVFVGGKLQSLLERYLSRAANENMSDPAVATRHARRIASLFSEVTNWGSFEMTQKYNLVLTESNHHNEDHSIELMKGLFND